MSFLRKLSFRKKADRKGESEPLLPATLSAPATPDQKQKMLAQIRKERNLPPWHPVHNHIPRRADVDFVARGEGKWKCRCSYPKDIFPEYRDKFWCSDCRHYHDVVTEVAQCLARGQPTSDFQVDAWRLLWPTNEAPDFTGLDHARVASWAQDVQAAREEPEGSRRCRDLGARHEDSFFVSGPGRNPRGQRPAELFLDENDLYDSEDTVHPDDSISQRSSIG